MKLESYDVKSEINARTNIKFSYNSLKHVIKGSVYIAMSEDDHEFLEMQMDAYVEISESSANEMATEDGVLLPRGLQCQIASFCYGALRGVMYLKTLNTPLESIVLPPLEFRDVIKNDIVISFR